MIVEIPMCQRAQDKKGDVIMTLAEAIKTFIEYYIMTDENQNRAGYEYSLEKDIHMLYALCTTDDERAIVKAIVSLEDH